MVSSNLAMRSIDIGMPQWAMHSAKESCSASDLSELYKFCEAVYKEFRDVDGRVEEL